MYRFLIHYGKVPVWEQINSCTIYEKQSFQQGRTFCILSLIEIIPIDNGKLKKSINAKIPLKDNENNIDEKTLMLISGQEEAIAHYKNKKRDTISFRDLVRLLIKFLKGADLKELKIAHRGQLNELRKIGITYPAQYLLFDFCLAASEGDHLDARLYRTWLSNSRIIPEIKSLIVCNRVYSVNR